ncbi:MAG: M28 family peptidase [Candidatus Obscuribacterales bacterium]|nr:M28 family peptidase [Candidatus Obscuribacterales bacterium]
MKDTSLLSLLDKHIRTLSLAIGERHSGKPQALERAAEYIEQEARKLAEVEVQAYQYGGQVFKNIEATVPGASPQCLVIGAHYDTEIGTPGANDNASGIAALLAILNDLKDYTPKLTIRFVAFANEEAMYFGGEGMGSLVYASALKEAGVKLKGMISLETIGYFTAGAGTQAYPEEVDAGKLGLSDVGNFLAFISDLSSKSFLEEAHKQFQLFQTTPSAVLAAPADVKGISLSDHSSFWKVGYPAIMITDTAPFRYPYYHHKEDTPDKINMKVYKNAVLGLTAMTAALAGRD